MILSSATIGQLLSDVDITVHCDVHIFEWLTRWMNSPNPPVLGKFLDLYVCVVISFELMIKQNHQMWYPFCSLRRSWKHKRLLKNA